MQRTRNTSLKAYVYLNELHSGQQICSSFHLIAFNQQSFREYRLRTVQSRTGYQAYQSCSQWAGAQMGNRGEREIQLQTGRNAIANRLEGPFGKEVKGCFFCPSPTLASFYSAFLKQTFSSHGLVAYTCACLQSVQDFPHLSSQL